MSSSTRFPPMRRVVTIHDENNVAKVGFDDNAPNKKVVGPGIVATQIWSTAGAPADIPIGQDIQDEANRLLGTAPLPNGCRFAALDIPPGAQSSMHRTETIDFAVVVEGTVEMDLDDSTVKLQQGDFVIQRGTNHAWCNRSDKKARLAVVLVDAKPLGIGNPVVGQVKAQ